jgi:FkbM family methyltransferase
MHKYMVLNPNTLGLKFFEPDFVENFVLNEIEKEYLLDDLHLTQDDFVIDLGAHTGVVSMYIAKKYGCRVESYEPSPRNFEHLVRNIKLNGLETLVLPVNMAVTKDGRDVRIGNNPLNWGGNNIYGEGDLVRSTTLAQIITSPVTLLKIDCEMAEFEILENLAPLYSVKHIRGEFHGHPNMDIDHLLAHVKQAVPDTRVVMHYSAALRHQQMEDKRRQNAS